MTTDNLNKPKIRIKQGAGKNINVSCSIFRKVLYATGLINSFQKIDYIIITKQKEEIPKLKR